MTKTHNLLATVREWTDQQGNKHKHRAEVGALFRSKLGKTVVKIDLFPMTGTGWLAAEPCAQPIAPPGMRLPRGFPPAPGEHPPGEPDPDADIPF